jgi:hypothetical protein
MPSLDDGMTSVLSGGPERHERIRCASAKPLSRRLHL